MIKKESLVKVEIGNQQFNVNSGIWAIFEKKAGDKQPAVLARASDYIKDGKKVERALADALETFKLM